jgi:hypothetical protein
VLSNDDLYPLGLTIKRLPIVLTTKTGGHHRRVDEIDKLNLADNALVREANWSYLAEKLGRFPLVDLNLDKNGIGREGCQALIPLLTKKGSTLEALYMNQNCLDDECVDMLVEALGKNTALRTLQLRKNLITSTGESRLLKMLGDDTNTNFDSIYLANKTLRILRLDNERDPLKTLLDCNRKDAEYHAGRQKIWFTQFNKKHIDLEPFLDMDVKYLPTLLSWFTMGCDSKGRRRFRNIYNSEQERLQHTFCLARDWNVPALFGHLSADRARIVELEELVKTLKIENSELKEENRVLKEQASGMPDSKRKRKC